MSTVYGPVPSWRFGRSLGVDVITPPKKCTFNCVYCQLGRTKIHVTKPEALKQPLTSSSKVLSDLNEVLSRIDMNAVDIVTFSGTGEPTLNLKLGEIANRVKARIGMLPMAILTNSSLFHREDIRRNLSKFDLVVAKLDAGDDETFRLINRPADKELSIEIVVESIKKLKRETNGELALEVMLLESENRELTNIEDKHLRNLIDAVADIKPDIIQLEVPYRPPSEDYVKQPSQKRLELIYRELSETLGEEDIWVYGVHDRRGKSVTWLKHKSLEDEVLNLLKRRPCRIIDISTSLGIDQSEAQKLVEGLRRKNQVDMKVVKGEKYYLKREE